MNHPFVINIVLNYNRRDDTLACLSALFNSTYSNHKTILLDNSSTDGSVQAIQREYPQVEIIELDKNLGYAGNNNVGVRYAFEQGADWIFVLNEDTIQSPDCLSYLVQVGESDPRNGIIGPMVYHFDEPNVIQSAGGMLGDKWDSIHLGKDEIDQGQFTEPHEVEWVSGCAIMVRRAVIEQVGLIDERFFYFWEETEWCIRAGRAGWKIIHVPQAKLWHKGVQRNYHPKPSLLYYSTRNRLLFLMKHHAPIKAWTHVWWEISRTLLSWTLKPKWRSMHEHRDAMWHGTIDFLRHRWGQMPD